MPKSGREMLRLYEKAGWALIRQRGSHMRVQKDDKFETIPNHKELKRGLESYLLKKLDDSK